MATTAKQLAQLTSRDYERLNQESDQWVADMKDDQIRRQVWLQSCKIDYTKMDLKLRGGIKLRKFQEEGVQWLFDQHALQNGAILGDEMGLGKTITVVAYIAGLIRNYLATPRLNEHHEYCRPTFLIVCPLSVVENWNDHLTNNLPEDISFIKYVGSGKEREECQDLVMKYRKMISQQWTSKPVAQGKPPRTMARSHPGVDIIVTSYEQLMNDIEFFTQFHYTNLILDEAHRVKNSQTAWFTVLKRVPAQFHQPDRHVTCGPQELLQDNHKITSQFLMSVLSSITNATITGNGNSQIGGAALHTNGKRYTQLKKHANNILSYERPILLTGTLVQNDVAEMWTLFNLCYPRIFPINSQKLFNAVYDSTITGYNFTLPAKNPPDGVAHALKNLQSMLDVMMLRRIKSGVDINLPPKTSFVLYAGLTTLQRNLYRAILGKKKDDFMKCLNKYSAKHGINRDGTTTDKNISVAGHGGKKLSQAEIAKSVQSLNSIWQALRKIINHSYLIPSVEPQPYTLGTHIINASGKLILLDEILKRVIPKGHRVLIFTTSVQTLDILQDYCQFRDYNVSRLDGSVRGSDRGELISDFQKQKATTTTTTKPRDAQKRSFSELGKVDNNRNNDMTASTPIFLLSTRAAGVGITLTAADTVIFYDNDFNQAADAQAEQRCYRIGQDKPVLSIRLICKGSTEHLYYLRSVRKAALADAVLKEGKFSPTHNPEIDNHYVNVVVPDNILADRAVDDTEADAAAEAAKTAKAKKLPPGAISVTTSSGLAPTKADDTEKESATDSATLQIAINLLASVEEEEAEDDDDDETTTTTTTTTTAQQQQKKQLTKDEKEKRKALLYGDDDLDWITIQGYSPNYGKDKDGDDDGELDDRFVKVMKKQRQLGGLTDLMAAAEVKRDEMRRNDQHMIQIAADFDAKQNPNGIKKSRKKTYAAAADIIADTTLTETAKGTVFDTTNVPTMKLAHFQGLLLDDDESDEEMMDSTGLLNGARRGNRKYEKKRSFLTMDDHSEDDDEQSYEQFIGRDKPLVKKDLSSFLSKLDVQQSDDDENDPIIRDGPISDTGRLMRQTRVANTTTTTTNSNSIGGGGSRLKKRSSRIIDTDEEEEEQRQKDAKKKAAAAASNTKSRTSTTTTTTTTSSKGSLLFKSTTKQSSSSSKTNMSIDDSDDDDNNSELFDNDDDDEVNTSEDEDVINAKFSSQLQNVSSSPIQTICLLLKQLPKRYTLIRKIETSTVLRVQQTLAKFNRTKYNEDSMVLKHDNFTITKWLVDFARGEILKDQQFYNDLQQAFTQQLDAAQYTLKQLIEQRDDELNTLNVDPSIVTKHYTSLIPLKNNLNLNNFKSFIQRYTEQPIALPPLAQQGMTQLENFGFDLEQILRATASTEDNNPDQASLRQYELYMQKLNNQFLTVYHHYNTRLYLQQHYNVFNNNNNNSNGNDDVCLNYNIAETRIKSYQSLQSLEKTLRIGFYPELKRLIISRFINSTLPHYENEFSGYFIDLLYNNNNNTKVPTTTESTLFDIYYAILLSTMDNLFDEVYNMLSSSENHPNNIKDNMNRYYSLSQPNIFLQNIAAEQRKREEQIALQQGDDIEELDKGKGCFSIINLAQPVHIDKMVIQMLKVINPGWYQTVGIPDVIQPHDLLDITNQQQQQQEQQMTKYYLAKLFKNIYNELNNHNSYQTIDGVNIYDTQMLLRHGTLYTLNKLQVPLPYHLGKLNDIVEVDNDSETSSTIDALFADLLGLDNNSSGNGTPSSSSSSLDDNSNDFIYMPTDDKLITHQAKLHHINGNLLQPEYTLGLPTTALFPKQWDFVYNRNVLPQNINETTIFPPHDQQRKLQLRTLSNNNGTQQPPRLTKFAMARAQGYICINFADDSGRFGGGQFLNKFKSLSPDLEQCYQSAATQKDLPLGSTVFGVIDKMKTSYLANLIVMSKNDRTKIDLKHVRSALEHVFFFAKIHNLIVLGPKQGFSQPGSQDGAVQYKNYEQLMQHCSQIYDTDAFIVYFSRHGGGNGNNNTNHNNNNGGGSNNNNNRQNVYRPQQQQQQSANPLQRWANSQGH